MNHLTTDLLQSAITEALKKVDMGIPRFTDTFPDAASKGYIYPAIPYGTDIDEWTSGFWTGILWLSYELSGEEKYRSLGEQNLPHYKDRIQKKLGVNHHDLGFLYTLAAVANYRITQNKEAKEVALLAADYLLTRYKERGQFIQAWGDLTDPDNYRLIIDCLMNIPLLFWATEVSGNPKYRQIAEHHAATTASVILRPDGSTFHTFFFNSTTGEPDHGATAQGYADNSPWARGQAWGIYGFAMAYGATKKSLYLEHCFRITDFFLDKLPKDKVCYWDLLFTDGSNEERDTSAAAIAVCGLMELLDYLEEDDPRYTRYAEAADTILFSLVTNYTTKDMPKAEGLLKEGVYSKPHKNGVNEANLWGDYFYLEALMRKRNPKWKRYW